MVDPQLRASNEGLLRPRVARARGSTKPPCLQPHATLAPLIRAFLTRPPRARQDAPFPRGEHILIVRASVRETGTGLQATGPRFHTPSLERRDGLPSTARAFSTHSHRVRLGFLLMRASNEHPSEACAFCEKGGDQAASSLPPLRPLRAREETQPLAHSPASRVARARKADRSATLTLSSCAFCEHERWTGPPRSSLRALPQLHRINNHVELQPAGLLARLDGFQRGLHALTRRVCVR